MRKYYFVITNPNHHWVETKLIAAKLPPSSQVIVISFCEIRRLVSPTSEAKRLGIRLVKIFPKLYGLNPSHGNEVLGEINSKKRIILYELLFNLYLKPILRFLIKKNSNVIYFNDVAFPNYLMLPWLKKHHCRQVLIQEGIRFQLPNATEDIIYGSKEANYIFCWGNNAKKHFDIISNGKSKVEVTGSPRYYDWIKNSDKTSINKKNTIGIFTNPIDDQGFVSYKEKLEIFEKLIILIHDTIKKQGIQVILKTHPRELISDYENVLNKHLIDYKKGDSNIKNCIESVSGGIIFASSVGIELLLLGKNVAQIKLPKVNYIFDYVEEKVAFPIDDNSDASKIIDYLLGQHSIPSAYIDKHISCSNNPAERISKLLQEI